MTQMTHTAALPLLTNAVAEHAGTTDLLGVPGKFDQVVQKETWGCGEDNTHKYSAEFITGDGDRFVASFTEWWYIENDGPEFSAVRVQRVEVDTELTELVNAAQESAPVAQRSWVSRLLGR